MANLIEIYTDGACLKNPGGAGGWAAIILRNGKEESRLSGGCKSSTNNKMELTGPIKALEQLKGCKDQIIIYSDSQYVVKGMNSWTKGWIKNGWKTSSGDDVKNVDLWKSLIILARDKNVSWKWVKGHNGHPQNELADSLATKKALHYKV